jgi:hypothetical protein
MKIPSIFPTLILLTGFIIASSSHVAGDELSLRWKKGPGELPFLADDNSQRGASYNRANNTVMIVSRTGTLGVHILDGATGDHLGSLDMLDVSGGTFALNMVVVADDGVIYSGNLSVSAASPHYKLYRWASDDPFLISDLAYEGDPGQSDPAAANAQRWGDTMAIRGAGADTQILLASRNGKQAAILVTSDGVNFISKPINVTGINDGDIGLGIAFGPGNTFWGTASGRSLKLIQFDLETGTGTVLQDFSGGSVPAGVAPLGADAARNRLAGINTSTHTVTLWDVTSLDSAPVLQSEQPLPAANANVNGTGAVDFGENLLVALETNNGIALYDIVESTTKEPPVIVTHPLSQTVLEGANVQLSVVATGTAPLTYQWFYNDTLIEGATSSALAYESAGTERTGAYKVVITNEAGSVTSDEAQLTVNKPAGADALAPLWSLAPGDRAYLTTDHTQRGMAYNPATDHVLLLNRAGGLSINVLSAQTGEHLHKMDVDPTVIAGGTFALNMVGAADDGAVFAGNLTLDGTQTGYSLYRWDNDSEEAFPEIAFGGDPGSEIAERWGDTIAVRGAGANTQVLIGSRNGNRVALFTTTDGRLFQPVTLATSGGGLGIGFGEGNTFWTTAPGRSVQVYEFNLQQATATLLHEFGAGILPESLSPLGVDTENKLLAAIQVAAPDNLKLYDISNLETGPAILTEVIFPPKNTNPNGTGSVAFGNNRLFALDSNNGIMAFTVDLSGVASPVMLSQPALLENGSFQFHISGKASSTQVIQGSANLEQWENLGTAQIGTEGMGTFTDPSAAIQPHQFYRVLTE